MNQGPGRLPAARKSARVCKGQGPRVKAGPRLDRFRARRQTMAGRVAPILGANQETRVQQLARRPRRSGRADGLQRAREIDEWPGAGQPFAVLACRHRERAVVVRFSVLGHLLVSLCEKPPPGAPAWERHGKMLRQWRTDDGRRALALAEALATAADPDRRFDAMIGPMARPAAPTTAAWLAAGAPS